jgi:hypothetical protein
MAEPIERTTPSLTFTIRAVWDGADLGELNAWLAANGLKDASNYKSGFVSGQTVHLVAMVKDENGRCILGPGPNEIMTVSEYHPLVVPLPGSLAC